MRPRLVVSYRRFEATYRVPVYRELLGWRSVFRKRDSPSVFIVHFLFFSIPLPPTFFFFYLLYFFYAFFSFTFPHLATGCDFMSQGPFPLTLLASITFSENQSPLTPFSITLCTQASLAFFLYCLTLEGGTGCPETSVSATNPRYVIFQNSEDLNYTAT